MAEGIDPRYLSGEALYGDDFDTDDILGWFNDEANAYYEMTGDALATEEYGYTQINWWGLHRHLPRRRFHHLLGFGSAFGSELVPLCSRVDRITIIESSERYSRDPRITVPVDGILAQPSGEIALPDASVDLVSCIGVLHHIPNVSFVLTEFSRVLNPGGVLLVREPIVSMGGDWGRLPRPGRTIHERGIPRDYFLNAIRNSGLTVTKTTPAIFPPIGALWRITGRPPYNSRALTVLDWALCIASAPNYRYHARNRVEKLRPAEISVIATS